MRSLVPAAVVLCVLAVACGGAPDDASSAGSAAAPVDIGVHVVSFDAPEGWEHLDHGREHRFHRELNQISAADHGPAVRSGYLRELRLARDLFLDGRVDDARAHVAGMDPASAIPDEGRRAAFLDAWRDAVDGGRSRGVSRYDAEVGWDRVMHDVERLPEPDMAELVDRVFPSVETAAHREIGHRTLMEVSGRPAVRVETWDRLSHDHRQSFLFVLNDGNLFLLRMEMGTYAAMEPAFETLAGSLAFHSAVPAS